MPEQKKTVAKGWVIGCGAAILAVGAVIVLRMALHPVVGERARLLPFTAPVLIAASIGGLGPGLFATVLSILSVANFFNRGFSMSTPEGVSELVAFGIFVALCVGISLVCEAFHLARRRALDHQVRLEHEIVDRKQAQAAERSYHERFRVTLSSIADAVVTTDPAGKITFMNGVAESLSGWSFADAEGRAVEDVLTFKDEETEELFPCPTIAALREGGIVGVTSHALLISRSGTAIPIEDTAAPLRTEDGVVIGAVLVFHDVTERRRADRTVRSLLRISERLSSTLDIEALLNILVEEATALTDAESGCAGTLEGEDMVCRQYLQKGKYLPLSYKWPPLHGLPGWLTVHKTPYLTNDAASDLQIVPELREAFGVKTAVSVPIVSSAGTVLGFFELHNKRGEDGFTAEDVERLTAVSHAASIAIQNALAFGAVQSAEGALRESEDRFLQLADNIPAGFIYQMIREPGQKSRFSYVSGGVETLCGVSPAEVLKDSTSLYRLVYDEDRDYVRACEEESFRTNAPFDCQFRMRTASGEVRWFHCRSARRGQQDEAAVWDGIAVDITARKQAEEALRESEERLRLALDAGEVGVWDWDIPRNVITWSDRIYDFHGVKKGEFGGSVEEFERLIHPEDAPRVREAILGAMAGAEPYRIEFRLVRPDGKIRWISTNGRVFHDGTGAPARMLGATVDVTECREAEEKLRESARRKDEFLAMLGHELRNPLGPIRNAVEILRLSGPPDEGLVKMRDLIDRQVGHLSRLVDDLLDVSRITQGKILLRQEKVNLRVLVQTVVEDLRSSLPHPVVNLEYELPKDDVWVVGDSTRIAQIVGNLLHNSAKFTDVGGNISISLASSASSGLATITVVDSGIGMDEQMLQRLFEPFSQADRSLDRSRGGLGLGLALVKGLVELHGGSVRASSAGLGRGSVFEVSLPLAAVLPETDKDTPSMQLPGTSLRVLVIEDNRDAALSLRMLLELGGHEVAVCMAGELGVKLARDFDPDVIICDIGLPGGMDGYAVAEAVRADERLSQVRLIALSGYGQEEDKRRAAVAGFDSYLVKPVEPVALELLLANGLAL